MVRQLSKKYACPIRLACDLVGLSPSTYYYRSQKADERELVAAVKEVAGQYVAYGPPGRGWGIQK